MMASRIHESHIEEAALGLLAEMGNVVAVASLAQARIESCSGLRSGQSRVAVMNEERTDE